ncbi:coiled-coil domain-containing protein 112-like [Sycon ciliatum]|uniref:coiled-coil domain-containing protein 112-like n=1 Tax=Sycon ciliatum TaxID=27933 RepID=UPI0031F6240C
MEDVDTNVKAFKERQRKIFNQLLHDEQVLAEAIQSMEKKVEAWERQSVAQPTAVLKAGGASAGRRPRVAVATGAAGGDGSVPPAVSEFERFLQQTGGHEGGWDDIDHQGFLNLRQKFKGKENFNDMLSARIPGRSPAEVARHESWYAEYEILLERKKDAIKKWKQGRKAEMASLLSKEREAEEDEEDRDEADAKEEELRRQQAQAEQQEKKERVRRWKTEQKELMELEQQISLEKGRKEAVERARRLKSERVEQSKRLSAYKQQQLEEKALRTDMDMLQKQEEAERRRLATQQLGKFQERDRHALDERKSKQLDKERADQEREERLSQLKSQVQVNVERDPSRLTKMTAGWEERRRQTVEQRNRDTTGPLLSMPHRAVPTWRQGL